MRLFDAKSYPILAARCAGCHIESVLLPLAPLAPAARRRAAHMFDYSDQELSTILEWLALERRQL